MAKSVAVRVTSRTKSTTTGNTRLRAVPKLEVTPTKKAVAPPKL